MHTGIAGLHHSTRELCGSAARGQHRARCPGRLALARRSLWGSAHGRRALDLRWDCRYRYRWLMPAPKVQPMIL